MSAIVPFGKYKGRSVDVLAADQDYCNWLAAQPWFREKFANIYKLVVVNQGEPAETPEHNALQALLLDKGIQVACVSQFFDVVDDQRASVKYQIESITSKIDSINREIERLHRDLEYCTVDSKMRRAFGGVSYTHDKVMGGKSVTDQEMVEYNKARKRFEKEAKSEKLKVLNDIDSAKLRANALMTDISELENSKWSAIERCKLGVVFESMGFDAVITYGTSDRVGVEVKVSIGDDYPAVIRQVKKGDVNRRLLIYETASWSLPDSTVRAVIENAGIECRSLEEIRVIASKIPDSVSFGE